MDWRTGRPGFEYRCSRSGNRYRSLRQICLGKSVCILIRLRFGRINILISPLFAINVQASIRSCTSLSPDTAKVRSITHLQQCSAAQLFSPWVSYPSPLLRSRTTSRAGGIRLHGQHMRQTATRAGRSPLTRQLPIAARTLSG